jgi:FtsH-binding integral membrane protein
MRNFNNTLVLAAVVVMFNILLFIPDMLGFKGEIIGGYGVACLIAFFATMAAAITKNIDRAGQLVGLICVSLSFSLMALASIYYENTAPMVLYSVIAVLAWKAVDHELFNKIEQFCSQD